MQPEYQGEILRQAGNSAGFLPVFHSIKRDICEAHSQNAVIQS